MMIRTKFMSASMGLIGVSPSAGSRLAFDNPCDLEEYLAMSAARGSVFSEVMLQPQAFEKFASCLMAMAAPALRPGDDRRDFYAHCSCSTCEAMMRGAAATDDQLRAECSRRGIGHVSEPMCTVAERDEWKRRAEAAEAHLRDPKRVIRIETESGSIVDLGSVHNCGRLEFIVTRVDGDRLPMRDLLLSGAESGIGIATKSFAPDNSIDILDEDRLCDDAD